MEQIVHEPSLWIVIQFQKGGPFQIGRKIEVGRREKLKIINIGQTINI